MTKPSHVQIAGVTKESYDHWNKVSEDQGKTLGQFITDCVEEIHGKPPRYCYWKVLVDGVQKGRLHTSHLGALEEAKSFFPTANTKIVKCDETGVTFYPEVKQLADYYDTVLRKPPVLTVYPKPETPKAKTYSARYKTKGKGWSGWIKCGHFGSLAHVVSSWSQYPREYVIGVEIREDL